MTPRDIVRHIQAVDQANPVRESEYQRARALWEIALQLARIADYHTPPQKPTQSRTPPVTVKSSTEPGIPIASVELSRRGYNACKNAGIDTLEHLADLTEGEAARLKAVGRRTLDDFKWALSEHGMTFRRTGLDTKTAPAEGLNARPE